MEEVIDLGNLSDLDNNSFSNKSSRGGGTSGGGAKSVNFGGGLELLMNDKLKSGNKNGNGGGDNIDLDDLNELEDELNDLSDAVGGGGGGGVKKISKNFKSDFFGSAGASSGGGIKLSNYNDDNASDGGYSEPRYNNVSGSNVGASTANTDNDNKTWDGFGKFSNIPLNPDANVDATPQMSKEELLREKFKILQKLEELETKGVRLSKKYSMESSLLEMKGEYETHVEEREKKNSVKFQQKLLMTAITGLEFLNNKFDPFDLKLDGWSEQINENVDDYEEIFGELHEKYKSKAKMAPELKLLFQLGGSAIMLHMTNTMFKSAMPGMDDIMRQNPELMKQFTQAAVNTMSQSSPNFGNFMGDMMGAGGGGGGSNKSGGGGAGGLRSTVTATGGGGTLENQLGLNKNTNYTVTVGAGGTAISASNGGNGNNSVFSTITSVGGGGGGHYDPPSIFPGNSGGSGGGGAGSDSNPGSSNGGSGTSNQGYAGGNGLFIDTSTAAGAGGGGAGQAGSNGSGANLAAIGGKGGNGVAVSITGASISYAGGGGGGVRNGTAGAGGTGGGGAGDTGGSPIAGTTNRGGGGGASGQTGAAGALGGSGVVILRWPTSSGAITIGAGLTGSTSTDGSYKVTTITAGTGNVSWA